MKKQYHNLIIYTVVGLGFIASSILALPMPVRAQPLPRVVAFTVQARANAQAPTFDYTVEFNGSSCLKTAELWRAPYELGICDETTNGCNWSAASNPVKSVTIPTSECDLSTGSISDTPSGGTFMYGAHIVDQANNIGYEQSRIKIVYTPSTVVTLTASDPNAAEPSDNGTFTVSRTGSTAASLNIGYNIAGTSASSATDFTLKQGSTVLGGGGSIVIPAGAVSAAVTVEVMDDTIAESSETVVLNLTAASQYALATPTNATVTITDNDGPTIPTVTLTASDPNAAEPSDNGTFTVSRTGSTASVLSVGYNIGGTSASSITDFTLKQGTTVLGGGGSIVIPVGAVSAAVTVEVMDDTVAESPETVVLNLTPALPYVLATPTNATVTITDNDGAPATCSDGTALNQCSVSKPKFCSNGTLIDKASQCGCPTGQTAQGDSCASSSSCSANISTGATVTVRVTTTDPENDPLYYTIAWGNGATTRVPGSGTVSSGFAATQTYSYNAPGTFTVTATAMDVNGGLSPASDPLTMCVTGPLQCTPGNSCSNVIQGQTCPGTFNNTCACVDKQDSCPGTQGAAGDLTCDTLVDVRDLGVLFHFWGKATTVISACGTPLSSLGAGITLDAIVNDDDFAILLTNWN